MELLKKSHFDNPDDPTSFTIVSKKTDDAPTIFLNEYSKSIYMKYKDRETDKGLLFPMKSNQKMNKSLKKIACKLGITREVSKKSIVELTEAILQLKYATLLLHTLEEGLLSCIVRKRVGQKK